VQPCNQRGRVKPGSEPIEATAELVAGDRTAEIVAKVVEKYGFFATIAKTAAKVVMTIQRKPFRYADRAVIVTLPGCPASSRSVAVPDRTSIRTDKRRGATAGFARRSRSTPAHR